MANSDVLVRLKADTQSYDANIAKARKQLNAFVDSNMTASGAMRQVQNSLLSMASSFVSVTAAIGAAEQALRYNIETARNFERSMSQLSSLTGMTGKSLETLKEYAIDLGSSTTLTASEVADAFKMIGSQQPQLLSSGAALKEVTKQAITLSEAAGIELATAAQTLSTSINQMGGDSANAERYVNVLAAASQKGAGDIAWLGEAITKSATAAKAVGTDYEELVANLEQLAKAGFDASTAGTALRSIIMNLEKQANNDFKPSVVGLTQAFDNLGKANLSIVDYQKLTGKMFASQAMALANAAGEARNMTEAITGTNIAEEQAKTNTANLDGALKQLNSAWEGLNLHINSSNGLLTVFVGELTNTVKEVDNLYMRMNPLIEAFKEIANNPMVQIAGNTVLKGALMNNPATAALATGKGILSYFGKPSNGTMSGIGSFISQTVAGAKSQVTAQTTTTTTTDTVPPVVPPKPKTKTPKKTETWAPIEMQSFDFTQIKMGRSKADVQANLRDAQKAYDDAMDEMGRAAAWKLVEKYQKELDKMEAEKDPFADFRKRLEIDSNMMQKESEKLSVPEEKMSGRERLEKGIEGISKITGGLNQMGVKVPEEIEKAIAVMQGAMAVIQGVQTVMEVLGTTSMTANTIAINANTAALVALTASMEVNTATNLIPGFKNGGVVPRAATGMVIPGNDHADHTLLYASSGETILNKAQSNTIAGLLERGEQGGGYQGTPYVEGEKIFLGVNNFLRKSGKGEIVTSRK